MTRIGLRFGIFMTALLPFIAIADVMSSARITHTKVVLTGASAQTIIAANPNRLKVMFHTSSGAPDIVYSIGGTADINGTTGDLMQGGGAQNDDGSGDITSTKRITGICQTTSDTAHVWVIEYAAQ